MIITMIIIIILITVKDIDIMITIEIMRRRIIGNNSVDSFTRIFEKKNSLKVHNMLKVTIIINTINTMMMIMMMIMIIMMMTKIVSIDMLY